MPSSLATGNCWVVMKMKVHIKKSEAAALLVPIGHAWDSGVFCPSWKDVDVVKRIFINWPELLTEGWDWLLPLMAGKDNDKENHE